MNNPTNSKSVQYNNITKPLFIRNLKLPNRVVFPAWQVNFANTDGTISEKLERFYTEIAKGGCGLIFTGAAVVSPESVAFDRVMRIDSDKCIPRLKVLFSKLEEHGSIPGIQLIHYGRQALNMITGNDLLAPSAIPCPVMSQFDPNYKVVEMTTKDIKRVRIDFTNAAVRAVEAGAKVIEIHAAHGYLLNEFLSPYSNKRTDNYGGTAQKRASLITEIISNVRKQIGDEIVISVRISGNEHVEGGMIPADFENILPIWENAGLDLVNISAGVYESMDYIVPPCSLGETPYVGYATTLRNYTKLPICIVGSIKSIKIADSIIASQKAELAAIGRAQVADPAIVNKSISGMENKINECITCNKCTFWTTGDPQMYCTINPDLKKD